MEVYMLDGNDNYAAYTTVSNSDCDRHGFLTDRVTLPDVGDAPLRFCEGFGDANPKRKPMKHGDFHTSFADIRLFSQRAVDALGGPFAKSGELFPASIAGRDEQFYWFWYANVIDCIDESKTKRGPPSSLPIERHLIMVPGFHLDRIGTHEIFAVPGQSRQFDLFVTDAFRDRVSAAKLKGFKFCQSRFDPKPWTS